MGHTRDKISRLSEVEDLLLSHPGGMTQAELARRLGVNRSTVNRYVADLPPYIYIEDDGRWKLDRTADLIAVRLNLHEALAIHLAARLLATRMDRFNPHAATALSKLGVAMGRWAERISRHVQQSAEVMGETGQRNDPVYLKSLEQLTIAWAEQRRVRIWHRSERSGAVKEYVFCPYFIEPNAIGQATYVIGLSDPPGEVRTLKVERIERVELVREGYEIPGDFDARELLKDAWGIWYTGREPVEVVLKFGLRVANRVGETRWHRSEQVSSLEDGGLLWRARIAEPLEMLPWVRGWGADVEVIAPEGLREAVRDEASNMMKLYTS